MDPAVLGQLIDEHGPALVLYARQWTIAPEDVVQESFLKLFQQRATPAKTVPWLFKVVRNGAISSGRSERRRLRHENKAAQDRRGWFIPPEGCLVDPEEAAAALHTLPPDEREVITLHLWGGLTFVEIAEVLGSAASSVHRWYQTGLDRLRERLQTSCNIPNP
jgi:RNA polymerase sigma-70 factor (ECF subfamily)